MILWKPSFLKIHLCNKLCKNGAVLVLSYCYVAESGINEKGRSVNIFENVFKLQFSYCETLIYLNEVLLAVKIKTVIFWVIPSCSLLPVFQRDLLPVSSGYKFLSYPEDGGSTLLRNVGSHLWKLPSVITQKTTILIKYILMLSMLNTFHCFYPSLTWQWVCLEILFNFFSEDNFGRLIYLNTESVVMQ